MQRTSRTIQRAISLATAHRGALVASLRGMDMNLSSDVAHCPILANSISPMRREMSSTNVSEAEVVSEQRNPPKMTLEQAEAALRDLENMNMNDDVAENDYDEDPTLHNPPPTGTGETRDDIKAPVHSEKVIGNLESKTFQTETRQMLDIVTNSLYTDKEVFLRELISNASDALEKARYLKTKGEIVDNELPLEIRIFTDEEAKTITIQDTGIGMNAEELVSLLGTIARSGSKQWAREHGSTSEGNNIIGQFGVGFYSSFMVGNKVEVFTRSAKIGPNGYVFPLT